MKKIFLVILGSFILLSTVTFGCPDKKLHNTVTEYLGLSKAVHVEGKRMFIASDALAREAMDSSEGDVKEAEKIVKAILNHLYAYSKSHDLEIIVLNEIKGWNKKKGASTTSSFLLSIFKTSWGRDFLLCIFTIILIFLFYFLINKKSTNG